QSKLVKYFSRQLSCKRKVALQERNAKLEGFPQLLHWFRIVDIRKEVMEEIAPGQLSLEDLLDMTDEQVCATVEKFGANREECARLNASLSCLRSVHKSEAALGAQQRPQITECSRKGSRRGLGCTPGSGDWILSTWHKVAVPPRAGDSGASSIPGIPPLCIPMESRSRVPAPLLPAGSWGQRTPNIVTSGTPPGTPPVRRRNKLKPPGTPPPSSRKLIHLIPGFTALHRSKSHEFQLGHRVDEAHTPKVKKKNKPLNLKIHNSVGSCENIPAQRSPLLSERSLRSFFVGYPPFLPSTPPVHTEATFSARTRSHPSHPRRISPDPFSPGSVLPRPWVPSRWMELFFPGWLIPAWLKCHNKCTKEAPPCHLLIIHRGALTGKSQESSFKKDLPGTSRTWLSPRTEPRGGGPSSVLGEPGALQTPQPGVRVGKEPFMVGMSPGNSNSFGKSSGALAAFRSRPVGGRGCHLSPLSPGVSPPSPAPPSPRTTSRCPTSPTPAATPHQWGFIPNPIVPDALYPPQNEEGAEEVQESEDDFEEMNLSLLSARNFPRKASQTSIFLQEWDIPFEQLEVGELIGKGRFGQVFHGRWHGEVAIRLIDIERDNEDQLKAFKREVMAYRQTRHENVVLFMGACMSPPHLAIITSLCKGRTLYSVVRDAKIVLDVNKTRQIAQEIVKGMGYLHAKGILHKDLKSKNVFYDNGKVVITDFGLFSISGVLQAGRRENKLRIQNGWLCHLAPEIIRQLSPDTEEDKLPFSKHSDVFALGTIWYELHAREWPFKTQPAEAIIWQVGRGMKPNLSQIGMGKEISDILLFCWAYEQEERPTFTKLMDMLEKLPKRNRRLSHPGHFWKSAE
ncbi:KSR2 Kinase, partial [Cisticola juncidis]|nr:KSR2 Kinase [Cisticola juncidis]